MALTDTDRRRMVLATAVTVVALPALWLASSGDNSSAPTVAVAGVDVGTAGESDAGALDDPIQLGGDEPVFLDGPSSRTGAGQQVIAVPAPPSLDGITGSAIFRSSLPRGTCIVPAVPNGSRVTVVNLDNDRSIACTSVRVSGESDTVVLSTNAFAELADLTDAPISVEIRR